jgi:hypothetical protein
MNLNTQLKRVLYGTPLSRVMTQFVLDPTASPDTRCAEESPVLGFVLPDGSNSREVD